VGLSHLYCRLDTNVRLHPSRQQVLGIGAGWGTSSSHEPGWAGATDLCGAFHVIPATGGSGAEHAGRARRVQTDAETDGAFCVRGLVYWGALIPLRAPLFRMLYAGKYMDASALLPLFAAETIVWSAALAPAILLRAMESPRSLFLRQRCSQPTDLAHRRSRHPLLRLGGGDLEHGPG